MKTLFILSLSLALSSLIYAQVPYNSAIPNGYTRKASVSEQVGLTDIKITYHRPSVRGREGKIWGGLVHAGFVDQGFGNRKPAPWRAGANETTVIEFSEEVKIEGKPLPKGRYGLFIAYDSLESTVIFSKRADSWGSFFYDETEDVLRVKVKPQSIDKTVDNLKFEFLAATPNSAIIALQWEKKSIPFKVEVDFLKQQFEALEREAQNPRGFTWQGLNVAANWTLQNNYRLDRGLEWANMASANSFPGNPTSFAALSTKASILDKMGKADEATALVKASMQHGTMNELQQYGRQLIAAKKFKLAQEVFEYNYGKNPGQFATLVGMARGLSANGEYAKALEFAEKAMPLAPNEANKKAVSEMVVKLKEGKDIN